MSKSKKPLPPPNMAGTDADEVLSRRLSVSTQSTPAHTSPTPAHTQVNPVSRESKSGKGTRPDPDGMRRTSFYISTDAAQALDAAVEYVLNVLGADTPRHVALSALLHAGAERAPEVARRLVQEQAAQLQARLAQLQQSDEQQ